MADARLEPPRGVQREGKILARKPSRPTEITGMGEGLRSAECRDLVLSCRANLEALADVPIRDRFRGIPRFLRQNLAPSVIFRV